MILKTDTEYMKKCIILFCHMLQGNILGKEKSLYLWMRKYGKEATWQRMVRALEKIPNKQGLAHSLQKKYCSPIAPFRTTKQKTFHYLGMDEV